MAALTEMKESLPVELREAPGAAASLMRHIKGGMRRATERLADQLSAYLSVRVQDICQRYGMPDDRIHLELTLPDLFTDRLDRVFERVDKVERFAEGAGRFTAESAKVGVKTLNLARMLVKTKFAPAVGAAGAVVAVGALASGSGWAADRAARIWIQRMIRLSELSASDLDQITAEVMDTITEQTNNRVHDLERLLA